MTHEELNSQLISIEQSGLITKPDKNLRSKIDSILRSIENLTSKKVRIEFEIQRQKKSLVRKREELKKVSKPSKIKLTLAAEASVLDDTIQRVETQNLRRLDSMLLQKSDQILERAD